MAAIFLLWDSVSPNGSLSATLNIARAILSQGNSSLSFLLKALQWLLAPLRKEANAVSGLQTIDAVSL